MSTEVIKEILPIITLKFKKKIITFCAMLEFSFVEYKNFFKLKNARST